MKTDTKLKRNSDLIVAEMDGDLVMLDVAQGTYFSINQVGAHVWTQLEAPQTVAELIRGVQSAFQASDTAPIEADVTLFLTDLASNKLISEVTA